MPRRPRRYALAPWPTEDNVDANRPSYGYTERAQPRCILRVNCTVGGRMYVDCTL